MSEEIVRESSGTLADYSVREVGRAILNELDMLRNRIAELEEKQRWIPASERLPEVNGWYLCGMVSFLGATFTNEIYFDAVNIDPRWNNPAQDRVYCWLDGVPELPEPPKVQE